MEKMIRMCLNWKVIGGLTVVGLGLWLMAPNLLAAALPILLIAVCPLSMLLMMKAMGGRHDSDSSQTRDARIGHTVEPSREVHMAQLRAQRETLDNEISALDSQETVARGAAALAQNDEERNRQE